jgi:hypothetical protein
MQVNKETKDIVAAILTTAILRERTDVDADLAVRTFVEVSEKLPAKTKNGKKQELRF